MSHIPHWISSLFKPSSTALKKKESVDGTQMILEELDSRVLFSADPFSSLIDSPDSPPLELQAINIDLQNETDFSKDQASASNIATEIHNEIIFIDAGIDDHDKLIEDLVFTESQSRVFTVVVLDSEKDGIEQITESLQDYENLNSIHIISHGTEDRISLGSTQLSSNNINDYSTSIELWQNSLDQEADLLIYGCDLAGNDAGKALTDQLSLLTGADVAASVDETGSALQGGDWTLEYSTGDIETNIAFSQQFQQTWNGLLAYQTYRDEFNSVSLANSDGTQDWSNGAWQEIGESDGANAGKVIVKTVLGEQGLRIRQDGSGVLREVDLSGSTSATLSFDYARIDLDDVSDSIVLEISSNGGGSWTQLDSWQGPVSDSSLLYANYDISDYIATDTQIRFVATGLNDGNDEFFFDNIQIAYAADLSTTSEFLVNQNTTDLQETSAENRGSQQSVSVAEDDSYVVTWSSVNQDGSGWGIYARRFDSTGTAMTDEILVNQTTADNQQWASVASDASGNFVATWTSTNQDGTVQSVYARQFDMNGIALNNEFRVNDTATGSQTNSTIKMNASGSFIISWQGNGDQSGNIDANGVFGQLYDASGTAIGNEFLVNPSSTSIEGDPAVAIDDNGNFIVVWDDAGGVQAQLYSNTGTPQGSQFNINPGSSAGEASVAMDATGDFVVTWRATLIDKGVYAKRFDALGNAKGNTFVVNTTTSNDQTNPSVAMDSAGNFIVVWEGKGDGDSNGVFGRKFNADGTAVDGEFLINQTTSNTQHMASVTMVSLNNFIAVWSGEGAGDSSGIFARQYSTAYTINEGDSLALNGSHLSDLAGGSLTYSWDLNNDGNYSDVVGENLTVSWSDLQGFGINDNGVYTIGLKVDDGAGGIDLKSATVTVINTAPVISTTGSTTVDQNSVYTLNLSTTDLGEDTISSWTINWGDGTIETFTGNPAAVTHTYTTDSYSTSNVGFTYNILASVTDEDGTHLQNDLLVTDYTTSGGFYHYSETGEFLELIGNTELDKSIGVIVGPDGNWYGTGESSNNVYRYNTDGNTSKVIATGFGDADGLAFGPDGNLYVADWANSLVYKITHNTTDDSYTKTAITINNTINNPYGLVFGPDGHLYVNSYTDHSVHRLQYNENDPGNPNDDTFTESVYVSAGLGGLNSPEQMAFGPDGKLYLTSAGSNEILRYNPETDDMDLIATLPSGGNPEGIAFGPDGNLYISDHVNGDIIRFNLVVNDTSGKLEVSGAAETFIKGTDSGLTKPVFMAFIPEQQVTVTPSANTLPTLTAFSDVITTTNEDTEVEITFSDLQLQGDEFDAEGAINSFVVKEISSGTLKIGADAASATAWVAVSNDKIDAGNHAYWTPSLDALGTLDAFSVVAEDQQRAISIGNIIAQVEVTIFNNIPTTTGIDNITVNENAVDSVIDLLTAFADVEDDDADLVYTIQGNTNTSLFSSSILDAAANSLTLNYALNQNGTSDITIRATDSGGEFIDETFTVTVNAVNSAPTITSSLTLGINENTSFVQTLTATDPETDPVSFNITGGNDAALFEINISNELHFKSAPDFESPADIGFNNIYEVEITVDDGNGGTDIQLINVTVTNVNEAPTLVALSATTVNENIDTSSGYTVGALTTTDEDTGDSAIYTINGGTDAAFFSISGSNNLVLTDGVLDFETQSSYEVTVNIKDSGNLTHNQNFTINVNDLNEAPVFDSTAVTTATEDTLYSYTINTSDVDGDGLTITATTKPAWLTFTDNGDGTATLTGIPDNSHVGNHSVVLSVSDSSLVDTQSFTVYVANTNDAPVISSDGGSASAAINVVENQTAVTTVTAIDADVSDTPTFYITGGADQGLFSISSGGVLSFDSARDFETKTDSNTDGIYEVEVTADDGNSGTDIQTILVTVSDINESPTLVTLSTTTVNENIDTSSGYTIGTLTTTDEDASDSTTYTINGGADAALFSIIGSNLVLTDGVLDFETQSSYDVTVKITDSGSLTHDQTFTINVNDLNEAPVFDSAAVTTATEDTLYSYTINTSDVDGDSLSIFATTKPSWLTLTDNGDGTATITGTPDNSHVGNHSVVLSVSDGSLVNTQSFTVSVANTNDAPVINSDGGSASAAINVVENQTAVTTVTATDADVSDTPTFYITGGADQGLFSISSGGVLSFDSARDFETKTDNNTDGVYEVEITADDGNGGIDIQFIKITVTNVNEVPSITSLATQSTAENQTAVATISADDPENDTLSYSLSGGADLSIFSLDAVTGQLSFSTAPDFESPDDSDRDNVYQVEVSVDDGNGGTVVQLINVTVNNINEAPSLTTFSDAIATTDEDNEVKISYTELTLFANEADVDGTVDAFVVKAINSGSLKIGVSAGTAIEWQAGVNDTIDAVTHAYWTPAQNANGTLDAFELVSKDNYGAVSTQNVIAQVNVSAINDNPKIANQTFSIFENILAGTSVGTAIASDIDSTDSLSFSIVDGNSTNAFTINSSTGEITVTDSHLLDFENTPNFMLTVQVTDNGLSSLIDQASVNINLMDINESPDLISLSNNTVDENTDTASGYKIGSLSSSDEDKADDVIYKIVGGTDQLKFSIGGVNNDELILNDRTLDYENQISYEVTVSVIDSGGLSHEETFTIAIKDLVETELITSNNNETLLEEQVIIPTLQTKVEIDSSETPIQQATKDKTEKKVVHTTTEDNYVLPIINEKVNTESENQNQRISISLVSSDTDHSDDRRVLKKFLNKVHAPIPVENTDFQVSSFKVDVHELQKLFRESGFTESLDFLREQFKEATHFEQAIVVSSITVSTGLSIGYVIWLIRGGVLLSSVLSSLPAWRMIDPLPIMSHLGDSSNSGNDDSESLASLINKGSEAMKLKLKAKSPFNK